MDKSNTIFVDLKRTVTDISSKEKYLVKTKDLNNTIKK